MVGLDDVPKLKVQELKEELKKLGLNTTGVKLELQQRLTEALQPKPAEVQNNTANTEPAEAVDESADPPGPSKIEANGQQANSSEHKVVAIVPSGVMTELEKKKQRAAKFGVPLAVPEEVKKKLRAERFNLAQPGTDKSKVVQPGGDKATVSTAPTQPKGPKHSVKVMTMEEIEKMKARAARFGTAPPSQEEEDAARKLARAKRFNTLDEKTKREIRAKRFGEGVVQKQADVKTLVKPLSKKAKT